MYKLVIGILLSVVLLANTATAGGFFVSGGYGFGGDTLAKAKGEDGSIKLEAGSGFDIDFGYEFTFGQESDLLLGIALGKKSDSLDADNGDADMKRSTQDIQFAKVFNDHLLGAGLTLHKGVKYSEDINSISTSLKFDDASGIALQYEYRMTRLGFGLRYTKIEYDINSITIVGLGTATGDFGNLDGNNIEFTFKYRWYD